jgi:Xaa-Pro aminopeptidase
LPYLHLLSLFLPSIPLFTLYPSLYLTAEGVKLTEVYLDLKVTAFRAALSPTQFLEPSFPTIAGVNGNGAIVHYR